MGIRLVMAAGGVVALLAAALAATVAVGVLRCLGASCSYELPGYGGDGPGAIYGLVGGGAGLVAVLAAVAGVLAVRAAARPRRGR